MRQRRGLTLLELALVMAIAVVIAVSIVANLSSMMQAVAVGTGGEMIRDTLAEGRSRATALNRSVEVRFYAIPSPTGGAPAYSALQLHWVEPDGTTPPIDPTLFLPRGTAIDATVAHSTLIAANTETATPDATDPHLDANTRVFRFLPGGGTDLNPATDWFVTVRAATQSDPARFPADWSCVRVDATTGRPQIYRP
jgi:uncharacterized protein (TIGR02596 family)